MNVEYGVTRYSIFIQSCTEALIELVRSETIAYAVQSGKDDFSFHLL